MNRRTIFMVIALIVVAGMLAGCGGAAPTATKPAPTTAPTQPPAPTSPPAATPEIPSADVAAHPWPKAAKPYKIALIVKNMVNPFWVMMRDGAEVAAPIMGVELTTYAPTKADNVEEQIAIMEDLITKKIDGIIIVPADSTAIVKGIEEANAAGIPVAVANTAANGGDFITFSAVENYEAMTAVTEYVMDKLGGQGKVIILEGTMGSSAGYDRKAAIDDVLKKYPNVEVLASQTALFQRAEAMKVTENLLVRFDQIDAVLACNDEEALGAIQAIEAAGRQDEIIVAGFDGNNDAMKAVAAGKLLVTLDQLPNMQSAMAMEALVNYLNGDTANIPKRIKMPMTIVDKSNVQYYIEARNLGE